MTKLTYVLVTHMGHDGPWLLIKALKDVRERRVSIKANKPKHEVPLRLKLLKIIQEPLPLTLRKANAAWVKAYAARDKAYAARDKANAAWVKANATRVKANAAWVKAYAARDKAYAARHKANAAWVKTDAAREKAYAAWVETDATWTKAINSPAGVDFHKQVCGCAWTPKQPDILRQTGGDQSLME